MNPNKLSDYEIAGNRLDAFMENQEELLKQGCSEKDAKEGANRHLWHLEKTDPLNYVRRADRKAAGPGIGKGLPSGYVL